MRSPESYPGFGVIGPLVTHRYCHCRVDGCRRDALSVGPVHRMECQVVCQLLLQHWVDYLNHSNTHEPAPVLNFPPGSSQHILAA